jgi:hypothetical protein
MLALELDCGVWDGNGRKQRTGVWVPGLPVKVVGGRDLHHLAEVHDRDPVGDVFDD